MLTIIERVLMLQEIEVFSGVTSERLSYVAAIAEGTTIGAGKVIYRENDSPDGLYVIISGSVRMRRAGAEVDRIGPGTPFGVWALFDDSPRMTTAETIEECRLLFLSRDDFYEVLSDHVEIIQGLFKHFVDRLRRLALAAEK